LAAPPPTPETARRRRANGAPPDAAPAAPRGRAGLVSREVDAGPPLRVTYRLTPAGEALRPALEELGSWAERFLGVPEGEGCAAARQPEVADPRGA
ncbi:winged helix-turn-helix transcriptional regulator, partial [Streptomyces sp. NPDC059604]|uniref:winged helix-turn-helix transcriptional regulator n=1 Tax=Streptomyces sp. NPDC059604 TaxID=3346881 RepID=UPI0036A4AF71